MCLNLPFFLKTFSSGHLPFSWKTISASGSSGPWALVVEKGVRSAKNRTVLQGER